MSGTERNDREELAAYTLMKLDKRLIGILGIIVIVVAALFAYTHWKLAHSAGVREELLSALPENPSAVVLVDVSQLRSSSFLPQLMAWAPRVSVDDEYNQFVQDTGFKYERDLDRVAMAFSRQPSGGLVYGVADGRFDRTKIEAYMSRLGERINGSDSSAVFSLKSKNSAQISFFTFLRNDRIAWTNDPAYPGFFAKPSGHSLHAEWEEHFARLAGSPLFAVVRQDSIAAAALAEQAPGGFRSPQLASLLSQLEWVTAGAKPDGDILRVVVEGESASQNTIHQLKDFLGGVLLLAQVGLNGTKNRKELDPRQRDAYLELLKSAQVEEVTRGPGKSVRVMFEVTPRFLDAVRMASAPASN
jgi:hypothetical protein